VVDAATVLSTHLTELLKNNMSGPPFLWRGAENCLKELPKEQASSSRTSCRPDHDLGHPARLAIVAVRAHFDPRSLDHPRRHRRRAGVPRATPRPWSNMFARAWRANLRAKYLAQRLFAADAMSANGSRLSADRWSARAGAQPRDCSVALVGVHDAVRDSFERAGARRRGAGVGDVGGDPALCASLVERFRSQTSGAVGRRKSIRAPASKPSGACSEALEARCFSATAN